MTETKNEFFAESRASLAVDASNLTVSIALATYNGERFLSQQLESILHQDVLPDELLVSDDGSTDSTLSLLYEFASSAPFKVAISVNPVRLGYRKNFLKAAAACSSEIIFFCDQDDIWDKKKISRMRNAFLNAETVMAYHRAWLIDEDGNQIGDFTRANPQNPWQPPHGMLMAFRRCLIIRLDLVSYSIDFTRPKEYLSHDYWISLIASAFGDVAVVDEPLIRYRQHAGNLYGADQPRLTFVRRLATRVKDRSNAFNTLALVCRANERIFDKLSHDQELSEAWRGKAQRANDMFRELATLYTVRSKAYNAPSFIQRLISFARLIALGAYSGTVYWTFGLNGAVRDVSLGVIFNPLVKTLGAQDATGDANCRRRI